MARTADPAENTIRVVVVDDQALFRSAIVTMINAQPGLGVVGEAANGRQAVDVVEDVRPDVVVMDVRMPDMDGVEATRRILAGADGQEPPVRVLLLTTFDLDPHAAMAIRHGASGFLLKDATPQMLTDAIRTVHTGNAVLSPEDLLRVLDRGVRRETVPPPALETLSEREHEVLGLVAAGLSNAEIGEELRAAESTVKTHVGQVLRKLGLRDRVQIVVFAYEHGIV